MVVGEEGARSPAQERTLRGGGGRYAERGERRLPDEKVMSGGIGAHEGNLPVRALTSLCILL
jgi:hypothetical protein